jgi:hypothetical protein
MPAAMQEHLLITFPSRIAVAVSGSSMQRFADEYTRPVATAGLQG